MGCARVGQPSQCILAGTMEELLTEDFGGPLHCFILCGDMHPLEKEYFESWRKK